jgi:integrase
VVKVAEGQARVLLLTFLHTAGRRSEVYRLTWSDVDFFQRQLRLTTRKRQDGSMEETSLLPTSPRESRCAIAYCHP